MKKRRYLISRQMSLIFIVYIFSAFRRFFAAYISGGTRGRRHVSMSGVADKRRTAGFTIEICQAERASATAKAEDPAGRLPRHHRRSRAGDRMYKHRR